MAFHDEARGSAEGAAESPAEGGAPPSERGGGASAPATRPTPAVAAAAGGGGGGGGGGGAAPTEPLPADEVRRGDLGQRVLGDVGRAGWDSATARHSHGLAYVCFKTTVTYISCESFSFNCLPLLYHIT